MPASVKYDDQFNTLLTCFAFNRVFGTPEESNEYYRKLTEHVDEYVQKRVQIALNRDIQNL